MAEFSPGGKDSDPTPPPAQPEAVPQGHEKPKRTVFTQRGKDPTPPPVQPEALPPGYKKPEPTVLDRLLAHQLSPAQATQELMDAAYQGLQSYCDIPRAYAHCELRDEVIDVDSLALEDLEALLTAAPPPGIVNAKPVHLEAITFFQLIVEGHPLVCENGDPLRPKVGASLFGPPGTGKTHIMAAFGRALKGRLDRKLAEYRKLIASFVASEYVKFNQAVADLRSLTEGTRRYTIEGDGDDAKMEEWKDPAAQFREKLDHFTAALRKMSHQPTDLLYLSFDQLRRLYADTENGRSPALDAIERARIVFVDDVNPHMDNGIVQNLIGRRYELGLPATIITTNFDAKELGGEDPKLADRLLSRFGETFMQFDLTGCIDWRIDVKARRLKLIKQLITARLAQRKDAKP